MKASPFEFHQFSRPPNHAYSRTSTHNERTPEHLNSFRSSASQQHQLQGSSICLLLHMSLAHWYNYLHHDRQRFCIYETTPAWDVANHLLDLGTVCRLSTLDHRLLLTLCLRVTSVSSSNITDPNTQCSLSHTHFLLFTSKLTLTSLCFECFRIICVVIGKMLNLL